MQSLSFCSLGLLTALPLYLLSQQTELSGRKGPGPAFLGSSVGGGEG